MAPSLSLALSPTLTLPADAAVQKFAWLGISGSGKTYGCGKFAEELIKVAQTVVIDTIGNWWGLRLASDGKKAGLQIPILGGDHGDIELDPSHGRLVAQTVVETPQSMVVDISGFSNAEVRRFVIDFATELLTLIRRYPAPRHIIWEECQDIVPQKCFGEDIKVLGAVQRLIKKGRNYGAGTSLISQRVAAVNKECLNQCHTVFAFRTIGKLDRKSIEDWCEDAGVGAVAATQLSRLETGTCRVYSPHWLKIDEEVSIGRKWTYDASATPDFSEKSVSFELGKVNLDKFKITMADAIAKAKDNDPEHLKKRIRELEALTVDGAMKPATDEYKDKYEERGRELDILRGRLSELAAAIPRRVAVLVDELRRSESEFVRNALAPIGRDHVIPVRQNSAPAYQHEIAVPMQGGVRQIPMRQNMVVATKSDEKADAARDRTFLTVLAQRGIPLTRAKILVFADVPSSWRASASFKRMIAEGWVDEHNNETLSITGAGRKWLGAYARLPEGDELYMSVLAGGRLDQRAKDFLRELGRHYPRAVSKKDMLIATGQPSSWRAAASFNKLVELEYATAESKEFLRLSDHMTSKPRRA